MEDLVLLPNKEFVEMYKNDRRFTNAKVFLVEDGSGQLQGLRFRQAWIQQYCYEQKEYEACLDTIMHSIAFSRNSLPPLIF